MTDRARCKEGSKVCDTVMDEFIKAHGAAVKIGDQIWMSKNLAIDDGDDIYFFCSGAIPVAASEIFNEGDFC